MDESSVTTRFLTGTQVALAKGAARLARHRYKLEVVNGLDQGRTKRVTRATVRIGSGTGCDLVLRDDSVSRLHAEISVRGDRYLLRDLRSTNGTRVNGVSIERAFLERGSLIALGETQVRFDCETAWMSVPLATTTECGELHGSSQAMRAVFGIIERVGPTDLSTLLEGETGTGKDVAARALHAKSPRESGPFVVLDCAALQGDLAESELYGHRRGAFTGADHNRAGVFEEADEGTVFLDEIGELPLSLQPKLLRVLEQREVRRLGENEPIPLDFRVVAATHRDLEQMVAEGTFRQDLYYRLAEVTIRLPALRDHLEDIPGLAQRLSQSVGPPIVLSRDALDALQSRQWPGNVRELRNLVRRAAALYPDVEIGRADLAAVDRPVLGTPAAEADEVVPVRLSSAAELKTAREEWTSALEGRYLTVLRTRYGDDLDAIAEHIGLHRKSTMRLLRKHGLLPQGANR